MAARDDHTRTANQYQKIRENQSYPRNPRFLLHPKILPNLVQRATRLHPFNLGIVVGMVHVKLFSSAVGVRKLDLESFPAALAQLPHAISLAKLLSAAIQ